MQATHSSKMAQWSGAVKLADLNDYIGPSQACIKPMLPPSSGKAKINAGSMIEVRLEAPDAGAASSDAFFGLGASSSASAAAAASASKFSQIRTDAQRRTAKVSLNDCLACSGCITSAETVLIMQQSLEEFYSVLAGTGSVASPAAASDAADASATAAAPEPIVRPSVFVATVSPQTRAALAVKFGISVLQVAKKLTTVLKSMGVHYVFDSAFSQDISLIEAREEFVHRFRRNQQQPAAAAASALPVLASECPGWICYAEKSQADALPHISAVKSPQQIMGTLVKQHLALTLGVSPARVYHVTLMPCYDKKLEASRDDFFLAAHETREVDCVLATNEVVELLADRCGDFAAVAESPLDALFSNVDAEQQVLYAAAAEAGGSGGYLETVFRHAARTLFAVDLPAHVPLPYRAGRNADTREVALEVGGARVLSFATAYGFRNIQNVTRQVKTGALKHQYVEIMACPAGCLNGGGQIKAADVKSSKELLRAVEAAFHPAAAAAPATDGAALSDLASPPVAADAQPLQGQGGVRVRDPADNPAVQALYRDWVRAPPMSPEAQRLFHTGYHAVSKADVNPLAIRW